MAEEGDDPGLAVPQSERGGNPALQKNLGNTPQVYSHAGRMLKKAPRPTAAKFVSRVSRAREAIENANNFYTNSEVATVNGHEGA